MLRSFAAFAAAAVINIAVIFFLSDIGLEQGTTLLIGLITFFTFYALLKKAFNKKRRPSTAGQAGLVCTECGYSSHITELFQEVSGSEGRPDKIYCPSCRQKQAVASSRKMFTAAVALLALGVILETSGIVVQLGRFLQWFAAFLLMIPAVTVLHELAHAVAGYLVGGKILKVEIGIGRRLFRRMLGECELVVNRVPTGGMCHEHFDSPEGLKWKLFATILAAPVMHLAIIAIILLSVPLEEALKPFSDDAVIRLIISPLLAVNALMLVISVRKQKLAMGGLRVESDGSQLLSIRSMTDNEVNTRVSSYYSAVGMRLLMGGSSEEARRWFDAGLESRPDNPVNTGDIGHYLIRKGDIGGAREKFAMSLERFDREDIETLRHLRPLFINNLAYATLLAGGEGGIEEADRLSLEAYEEAGWMAPLKGTRGAVLVEKGEVDEGIKYLLAALEENAEPYTKAYNACHLALAYIKRHETSTAREYLETAKKLDPNCPLIESVSEKLESPR